MRPLLKDQSLLENDLSELQSLSLGVAIEADSVADLTGSIELGSPSTASNQSFVSSASSDATQSTPPQSVTVAEGALVQISGNDPQSVEFLADTGTLQIENAALFAGQIDGLAGSDTLDLSDIQFGPNTTATYSGNDGGGTLTVTDGSQTANIQLVGNYLSSNWDLSSDGSGGTNVVDPISPNDWQPLALGAGGFIDGIDAVGSTMVVRTDTYGAYIWNGSEWQQLISSASMPANFVNPDMAEGVSDIEIAPSDPNIFYMEYDGYVFKSVNQGQTWTQTNFAAVAMYPNDNYRGNGQKMAVDPNNPNVVYAGTAQNGLFVSMNGGVTWQSVGQVPVAQSDGNGGYPGITGIVFDPAVGGVTNGVTNTIFAASYGNGVYESTNGGSTWSLLSGSPTNVTYAAVSSTGIYYAVDGSALLSYSNGAWSQLLTDPYGESYIQDAAVNPENPNEIVVQYTSGMLDVSYDAGVTWTGWDSNYSVNSNDIPWLNTAVTPGGYFGNGGLIFNPSNPDELIATEGLGVWTTSTLPTAADTPFVWSDQSAGIEQLVANQIIVPPGGKPIVAVWDRGFFYISNPNVEPSSYGPVSGSFTEGWALDYASSDPSFIVGVADWYGYNQETAYSTDGGQTWSLFANLPPDIVNSIGGQVAVSSPTNFILAGSSQDPYYTLDGGQTWNPVVLPGISDWSSFDWSYYLNQHVIAADRVLPNTFYMFYPDNGVFESTNGGQSWSQVYSGGLSAGDYLSAELEAVPGEAGNLFFTGGPQSGGTLTDPVAEPFLESTNQGATWTDVANVSEVLSFGFGAAAPGQSYPAIYIAGWVNDVYGVWQSINDAKSWTQVGTFPDNSLDEITTISGDPNIYGQVYVGFQGSGFAYLPGAAVVSEVSTNPTTGVETQNDTVTFTLTMSETVTVTGTPTLSLNDGGVATYTGGSGTGALTFSYTVSSSDTAVSALGITQINDPNGATITDSNGNTADLTGAITSFANLQVNSGPPAALTSVTESPSNGDLDAGNTVTLTLAFSSAVTVTGGIPTLSLSDGGTAAYAGGSGSMALTFTYTVAAGQNTTDLQVSSINLNSATIANGQGNATLSLNGITESGPQIDTTAPTVSSVTTSGSGITSGSGDLDAGKTVTLTVNFSETVSVAGGAPTLSLNDGGTATYASGSGTTALTFSYTAAAGQNTPDLTVTGVNLNSATITDGAGNAANLGGAVTNPTGALQIDTTAPTVSSVTTSGSGITSGSGDLDASNTVMLTVSFSEAVSVAGGAPTLSLNDGGTATYASGSGTTALTFSYTAAAGQNTPDLTVTGVNLNSATITDGAGNAANLGGAVTNPTGALQIDTTAPTVSSVTTSGSGITSGSGDIDAGKTVTLTVNFSETV